jgi:hypothetical protein
MIYRATQLHLFRYFRIGEKKLKTWFLILCIVRKVEYLDKVTRFECLDSYETEKLGSMLLPDKDSVHFVVEVIKIIDNEIVLMLKDKSCHAVLMKDNINAVKLREFVRELIFGTMIVTKTFGQENILNVVHKTS